MPLIDTLCVPFDVVGKANSNSSALTAVNPFAALTVDLEIAGADGRKQDAA